MKFPLRSITLAICATALSTSLQLKAGTVTVANTDDTGTGSLRAAIAAAINGDTIDFNPALNGATITLTSEHLPIAGLQVTIDASALPAGIKISGNSNSRIFSITASSDVTLNSLELFNGSVTGNGGGISAVNSELNCMNITVRNCVSSGDGGGIWASSISGTIDRCSFIGNDSGSLGYGGGIFFGGATTASVQNSVISGNRAVAGGGIAYFITSPSIINCTIQGNSGSGIYLEFQSAPLHRNTIIWGNRTGSGTIASQQIQKGSSQTADANVDYCLIEGAASTLNNLDGTLPANNPLFVREVDPASAPTTSGDLRLLTGSAALNAGDDTKNTTTTDLAGNPRKVGIIDLGAYEGAFVTFAHLGYTNPSGDANGNGITNFGDYAAGGNPTAPDDPTLRPTLSDNQLTFSFRDNAADIIKEFQKSTNLLAGSWTMIQASDYTSSTTTISGGRTLQTLTLTNTLLTTNPQLFFREEFQSAP